MAKTGTSRRIAEISDDYFGYMAKNYPVMCLSDEFYFFPRAKKSAGFLDSLDNLDEQKIKGDISRVKSLRSSLKKLESCDMCLEERIDMALLKQSMSTFLREFDDIKIWSIDPTLYLRLSLIGIDQLITRFSFIKADVNGDLSSRMAKIPRLLNEAARNLKEVPCAYLKVAIEMIDASIGYFKDTAFPVKEKKALQALADFKKFLLGKPYCEKVFLEDRQIFESILKDSFSCEKGPEEIFGIACDEYHKTLEQLAEMAKKVKGAGNWREALSSYTVEVKNEKALLALYSKEIDKIKDFFISKDVITIPQTQKIHVRFTPPFMRPFRASASYSSPVTGDSREPAYFYITGDLAKSKKSNSIHNEYIFLTAHETYPGHHLLDSIRRGIENPIREQVESPLFYEGWASYAEGLVDRSGYIEDHIQRMVGLKRRAWRAVRAMLDSGLRIGELKVRDGEDLLKGLGYASGIVKSMIRHYVLSPGYQSCYTIGKFEIEKLRKGFSAKLGLKEFHDTLLYSGQIPFHLAEERLQDRLCRMST